MVDYNLGTARGRIDIDASGASEGADEAERSATRATGSWQKASGGFLKAGGAMTGAAALVAAGFAVSVKSAADFEKQISGIAAVSGATAPQLEAIRQKALQLGKDTQFSASESAAAMEELVKAGIPLADVLNGAADASVALAAAGGVDIPTAATLASNAMNQFGLTAKQLPSVVDQIAGAANASAIDVGEFGMSLQQVGAVANLAGLSFEDTAVAIAEMGNAGIKGSDAGTSLKSFLSNLIPVTDKQRGLMQDLGIVTKDGANAFFDAAGKTKPLIEIQRTLSNALKGMGEEQKLATLETLFGSDAIRAAAVLANNGAEGYTKLSDAMSKTSAAEVAAKRMDNLSGKFEQFKGSLETAAIVIGTALLPAMKSIVDFITRLVNAFLSLSPGMQKTIIIVVGVTAAIVGVIGVVLTFIGILGAVLTALAPVAAMIGITAGALLGWILVIPIIIAAIVTLAVLAYKNFDSIRNFIIGVLRAIGGFFVSIWNSILGFFKSVWSSISGVVSAALGIIASAIRAYINIWTTIFRTAWSVISTVFSTGLAVVQGIWNAVWGTFGPLVEAVFGLIVAIVKLGFVLLTAPIRISLWAIKELFTTVFDFLKPYIASVFNFYKNVITTVINAVMAFLRPILAAIQALFTTVFNASRVAVEAAMNLISAVVSRVVGAIKTAIGTLGTIAGTIGGFFQKAYDAVKGKVGEIISFMTGFGGKVADAIGNLSRILYDKGKQIIQGLLDGITSMIGKVTDTITNVTGKISKFLPGSPVKEGPLRVLNQGYAGGQIINMLSEGMLRQMPVLQATLRTVTDTVPTAINSASSTVVQPIQVPAQPQPSQTVWDVGGVTIPAKDLEEMRTVQDFFDRIQQESRKRTASTAGVSRG